MMETGIGPKELTEVLQNMTADQSVKMVRELCAQLADSGAAFHGDIWPGNVTLDETGKAVLGEGSDAPANSRSASQVEYLAPEYFWDNAGDGASDVYSLGMLLYAGCNEGFLPFQPKGGALTEKDRSGALRKRMKGELISTPSGMSRELAAVIRKALAYEPEDRYASPAELLSALGETDEALPAPEGGLAAAGAAAAAAVGAAELTPETAEPVPEEEPFPEFTREAAEPEEAGEPLEMPAAEGGEEPLEMPAAAEEEPAPEPVRKYTVQKDFEKTARKADSVAPAAQKKKKKSALIPILCVAAAAVIGGTAWYTLSQRDASRAAAEEDVSEPFIIIPAESPDETEPPAMAEETVKPSLDDDEEAKEAEEETEAAEEEEEIQGSATVDGQEVTPAKDTVYLSGAEVNLRTGPGTSYEVAETLTRGTELQRTGTVNGWSQVQYEGEEYYVSTALISTDNPNEEKPAESLDEGDSGEKSDTTTSGTTAGDAANTGNTGAAGTTTGGTGTSTGGTGTGTSAGGTSTPAAPAVTATRDVISVTGAEVNLRSGPGTGNSVVATVPSGTVLQRTGTTTGWDRVVYKGQEVYISSDLASPVSASTVTKAAGTLKVTSDVNVRSGANTDSSILGIAKVGETLTITGITDGGKWFKVSYNGQEGYVNRKLVSVQDMAVVTEQSGTAKVTTRANVRSGPGTGYSILGVAEVDDSLTVTGYADCNWYEVSYDGKTGYIAANLVEKS